MSSNFYKSPWRQTGLTRSNVSLLSLVALIPLSVQANQPVDSSIEQKSDIFVSAICSQQRRGQVVQVIVKFSSKPDRLQTRQLTLLGAKLSEPLSLIDSNVVTVSAKNLSTLVRLPFVKRVSLNAVMCRTDEFTVDHSVATEVGPRMGLTGLGVTVAVIDSGISPSPDLTDPVTGASRILASVSFGQLSSASSDLCGHGTHVAGIIGGNGSASTGHDYYRTFMGLAPRTSLVSVRVLDATGQTKVSNVVSALQWAIANKSTYNIKVVNMSLGHSVGESYQTDPLCQAVEKAWKAGIIVVCAAGNDGRTSPIALSSKTDNEGYGTAYGSVTSPGNDPYVLTVGAMKSIDGNRSHDTAATYSGRGPSRLDFTLKPDVVAPGNQVISLRKPLSYLELTSPNGTVPLASYSLKPGLVSQSSYFKLSGTSMATPVVAGAVALMLEANPRLTPDSIKARLMVSSDKWLTPSGDADVCTYGAGYLNVAAALKCNMTLSEPALSPRLVAQPDGTVAVVPSPSAGQRAIWGSNVSELRAVWGNRAIWGSNTLSGSRAIWGSSVWADRAIWGSDVFSIGIGPIMLFGEK